MEKQNTARTLNAIPMPTTTGARFEGFAKFGAIPGGGFPAGIVLSTAGGRLSICFGSMLPVDMI